MSRKISAMDPADALTGAEVVPILQRGSNRRSTVGAMTAGLGLIYEPEGVQAGRVFSDFGDLISAVSEQPSGFPVPVVFSDRAIGFGEDVIVPGGTYDTAGRLMEWRGCHIGSETRALTALADAFAELGASVWGGAGDVTCYVAHEGVILDASQPDVGSFSVVYVSQASLLGYSAANPADWSGSPPTTVAEALDRVAAGLGPL